MRTFVALLAFAVIVNLVFAMTTMFFFHGEIKGAKNFADYFFYAVGSLTTSGHGNMEPTTTASKIWTSMYVLVAWVYIFYVAINHISEVKFRIFG
jgi:hypothetical protein